MTQLIADGIRLIFDPGIGLLKKFVVTDEGSEISPLHQAPWVGSGEVMPEGIAPHLAYLGGDFFCAPFASHEENSPFHGWPPNSPWVVNDMASDFLRATLARRVFAAQLVKEITLRAGHPFVYQRHTFFGGNGQLPVSNHANISVPYGGIIRTSPKTIWMTPVGPPELDPALGRSGLVYPAESSDPSAFPSADGTADLTRYPWFAKHEDFVIGLEAPDVRLGWTAVTRPTEGDVFLSLRSAAALPMTMLWHSNGGRDYPPWSGRHFGCLGVEEGAAADVLGRQVDTELSGPGAITLDPHGKVTIDHAIGAIRWPGGSAIGAVEWNGEELQVTGEDGTQRRVPFDGAFLGTH